MGGFKVSGEAKIWKITVNCLSICVNVNEGFQNQVIFIATLFDLDIFKQKLVYLCPCVMLLSYNTNS